MAIKNEKGLRMVGFYCDENLIKRIDVLAKKGGLPRAQLMYNMVDISADYLDTMDTLGVLAAAKVFQDMRQYLVRRKGRMRQVEIIDGQLA